MYLKKLIFHAKRKRILKHNAYELASCKVSLYTQSVLYLWVVETANWLFSCHCLTPYIYQHRFSLSLVLGLETSYRDTAWHHLTIGDYCSITILMCNLQMFYLSILYWFILLDTYSKYLLNNYRLFHFYPWLCTCANPKSFVYFIFLYYFVKVIYSH